MKRAFALLMAVAVVSLLTGFTPQSETKKAPNFSLKTSTGKTIELSKLKGKMVVVNFWATWCGPCRAEIPGFIDVYNKYKSKGLEIVGISLDEGGWKDVEPFVKKLKITYPVVLGTNEVAQQYGNIEAIPTTFIVDKEGRVVSRHVGYMNKEDFENTIKSYL
jgi:peroxiredoxin